MSEPFLGMRVEVFFVDGEGRGWWDRGVWMWCFEWRGWLEDWWGDKYKYVWIRVLGTWDSVFCVEDLWRDGMIVVLVMESIFSGFLDMEYLGCRGLAFWDIGVVDVGLVFSMGIW